MTGRTLRATRRRLGWTQRRLAAELGVTIRSVSRWETDAVPMPPAMAKLLGYLAAEHAAPVHTHGRR